MFKIVTVAALGYILYRLVLGPTKTVDKAEPLEPLEQEPDSGDFVDFEELE
jgi:hypothetical protein